MSTPEMQFYALALHNEKCNPSFNFLFCFRQVYLERKKLWNNS